MPQASTMAINDSVPTSVSFSPSTQENGVLVLKNDAASTGAGRKAISYSYSDASSTRPTVKVRANLAIPVEHTVDGIVRVAYVLRGNAEFIIPKEATALERADLHALFVNMLSHADIKGSVEDLEAIW